MLYSNETLTKRMKKQLKKEQTSKTIRETTTEFRLDNIRATKQLGNWEQWRDRGNAIRKHTIEHLDFYLEQFVNNFERQGGVVHFAKDSEEAVGIALQIMSEKRAKKVVKAKTMISEEIRLNEFLIKAGIETVETDLGEYIIQQANEHPSHIVGPAIHKTVEEIAELFSKMNEKPIEPKASELGEFARNKLRKEFLEADVGITGCNMAIADIGAISLVTNEGNARLVTSLPHTHIVLMGMERIVPSLEDFEVINTLLPRSSTGQKITAEVSIIQPKKKNDLDKPSEMHTIIIDNGRSDQLGDPNFQDILHCIRCGACLDVCPVYRHVGGHGYGSVYNGPIGAVLTPLLNIDSKRAAELANASSLCGACYEVCPMKIPLHDMLVKIRERNVKNGYTSFFEKASFRMYGKVFSDENLYSTATKFKGIVNNKQIQSHFPVLKEWTMNKELPTAKKSFRNRFKQIKQKVNSDE